MMLLNGVSFTRSILAKHTPRISMGPQTLEVGGEGTKKTTTKTFSSLTLLHCKLPDTLGKSFFEKSQN